MGYQQFGRVMIGGIRVYRPHVNSELRFKENVLSHLRKCKWTAELTTAKDVNSAVQYLYNYCHGEFVNSIRVLGSRHACEFLLYQSDNWERIRLAHSEGKLTPEESDFWNRYGISARRAIWFALENMVALEPNEEPTVSKDEIIWATDRVMISAEIMVQTAGQSTMAYAVFPDDTVLSVRPDNPQEYFRFRLTPLLEARKEKFFSRRSTPVPPQYRLFATSECETVPKALDSVFLEEHGITLTQIIHAAIYADRYSRKAEGSGFDTRFVLEDTVMKATALNLSVPIERLAPVFQAFILTPETAKNREFWKPKQEQRIIRRPFLRMPHDLGPHLAWVSPIIEGAVGQRLQDLSFRKCPPEWETSKITSELTSFSQRLDLEWNREVHNQFIQRGLRGEMGIKRLGSVRLESDSGPGEIDGLYVDPSDGSLIVVEVKRTQPGFDPDYWRGEMDDYLRRKNCYVNKHKKKIAWTRSNWTLVCQHFIDHGLLDSMPANSPRIKAVIVTKYPSLVSIACQDLPILSLAWVLEDFDLQGKWPF